MDALSLALAAAGGVLGGVADRFATRWPEHDEEHPPGRAIDWRTLACVLVGVGAFALLPGRFIGDQLALFVFGAWFVTLVIGFATDLDQRILPDELTLPVIPIALLYAFSGQNPLVGDALIPAVAAAILIPAVLYLPSIPFGAGAFGMGRQIPGRDGAAGRWRARRRRDARRAAARGRRPRRPARDAADRSAVVRAVRAVPHPRRAVGRAHPHMNLRAGAARACSRVRAGWARGPIATRDHWVRPGAR